MILTKSKQKAQFSDGVDVIHKFDIDNANKGLIFQILRSKMYSDPIGSICREIASNCRDAHREVKTPNKPVEIELVTTFWGNEQNHIIFRDYGPGLSPDRVANIYTKYGSSTKRNSNDQTGGWGLGAKTPFSYTDSFNVVTVFDGVKYVYNAVIDQTDEGRLALLGSEETNEPNMTEVIIPIIQDDDVEEFHTKALQATKFWDPKPVFIGFGTELEATYTVLEDRPEYILINDNSKGGVKSETLSCLIDEIYYPVNTSQLGIDIEEHENYCVLLKFKNGQLSVSSNRETLNYDTQTVNLLKKVIGKMKKDFTEEFNALIESLPVLHKEFFNYSLSRQFTNMDRSLFHDSFIIKYRIFELSSEIPFTLSNIQYMKPYKVYFESGENVRFETIELTRYSVAYTKQPFPIMYTNSSVPSIAKCRTILREYCEHHDQNFMVVFTSPTTLRYTSKWNVSAKIQKDVKVLQDLGLKCVDYIKPTTAKRAPRAPRAIAAPSQGPKETRTPHSVYGSFNKSYLYELQIVKTGKVLQVRIPSKTAFDMLTPEQFIAKHYFMPVNRLDNTYLEIEKFMTMVDDANLEFDRQVLFINKSLAVSLGIQYTSFDELKKGVKSPDRKWISETKKPCLAKFYKVALEPYGVRRYGVSTVIDAFKDQFFFGKQLQKDFRHLPHNSTVFDTARKLARKYGIKKPFEIAMKQFHKLGYMKSLSAIRFHTNGIGRYLLCYAVDKDEPHVYKRVAAYFSSLNYKPGAKNV